MNDGPIITDNEDKKETLLKNTPKIENKESKTKNNLMT